MSGVDLLAKRGWTAEALEKLLALRGWTPEAIDRLGLSYDLTTRPVGIPVQDATGDDLGSLHYDPTGLERPKMLADAGVPRELFPPPETIADDELRGVLLLVEGEPDAIRSWSIGIPAVAVPGAQNWRDEWAIRVIRPGRPVIVCFDCDQAGRTHGPRAAAAIVRAGGDARLVDLDSSRDDGADLTDFLNGAGTADEREQAIRWLRGVAERTPIYEPPAPSRPRPPSSPPGRPSGARKDLAPRPSSLEGRGHYLASDLAPEPSSWAPVDVVARAARPPEPPTIIDLLYPGLNHLVSGESESLKTWLGLIAATDELVAGRGVLWIDGDDVGSGALLERLRLLGVDDDAIASRFANVLPDEPLDPDLTSDVLDVVRSRACRLAVLDGFNPLLVLHGLSPDSGSDVEMFYRLIDPIRKAPAAVILSDNVVKAREARGAWAIGSERKKSKAEVHLGMRKLVPLVRGGTGKAKIDVHKDRPGFLTRPSPGVLVLSDAGDQCVWRIESDESRSAEGEFRPTKLMERVSRYLESRGEPVPRDEVEKNVTGKTPGLRVAIDRLVLEGYATEFEGSHGARPVRLDRSFREEDDKVERLAQLALQAQEDDE